MRPAKPHDVFPPTMVTSDCDAQDATTWSEDGPRAQSRPPSDFSEELESATVLAQRYRLSSMLGRGGMGVVFRARDLELDEELALKILNPQALTTPSNLERFKTEVRLARKVTHPNVARTFDFGSDGVHHFITMELVEGVPLSERLHGSEPLDVGVVVECAAGILHGLRAAHQAGVLHRDLKPGNVMLARDGRAVLLDFGIASAASADGPGLDGGRHSVVGTPQYMSPEQVEGSLPMDERSDLYSVGVLLYEMLTGQLPFEGASLFAMAAARLLRPAPPITAAHVPEWLRALTASLLATKPDARPADVDAVLATLERGRDGLPHAPPSTHSTRSVTRALRVAVLRLQSPADDLHVAESVRTELAEALASSARAQVIQGAAWPDECGREAAERLDANLVLEGRLERSGTRFRLRLKLSTVTEGLILYAVQKECTLHELTGCCWQSATAFAKALESKLVERQVSVTDSATLELYYRGRAAFHKRWISAAREATALLSQAYARAPDDPQIVSAYALALTRELGYHADSTQGLAERMVQRAGLLGGGRAEAQIARAALAFQLGDFLHSTQVLHQLLLRHPQHADALELLGRIRSEVGPCEEAVPLLALAREIDPTLLTIPVELARMAALQGDRASAARHLRELVHSDAPAAIAYFAPVRILHYWPNRRPVSQELLRGLDDDGPLGPHDRSQLLSYLRPLEGACSPHDDPIPAWLRVPVNPEIQLRRALFEGQLRAEIFAACGRDQQVFEELEQLDALALNDLTWLQHTPLFAELRRHPRFAAVERSTFARTEAVREALPTARAIAKLAGHHGLRHHA